MIIRRREGGGQARGWDFERARETLGVDVFNVKRTSPIGLFIELWYLRM